MVVKLKNKGDFAVAKGNQRIIGFPSTIRRKVQARFTGGEVTSDGGVMLLRQADRRLAWARTELARAQAGTIRLRLLKIGAVVLRNTRRVRLLLSSSYPHQELFFIVLSPARHKQWG